MTIFANHISSDKVATWKNIIRYRYRVYFFQLLFHLNIDYFYQLSKLLKNIQGLKNPNQ